MAVYHPLKDSASDDDDFDSHEPIKSDRWTWKTFAIAGIGILVGFGLGAVSFHFGRQILSEEPAYMRTLSFLGERLGD